MKKILAHIFLMLSVTVALVPVLVSAQGNVDPAQENTGITYQCPPKPDKYGNLVYGECEYKDLIEAVKKIVNWATVFTLEFSVIVIAYAGYLYMTSGDNSGKRKQANDMLWKVVVGIAVIVGAWLIVTLITNSLLTDAVKQYVPLTN